MSIMSAVGGKAPCVVGKDGAIRGGGSDAEEQRVRRDGSLSPPHAARVGGDASRVDGLEAWEGGRMPLCDETGLTIGVCRGCMRAWVRVRVGLMRASARARVRWCSWR